MRRQPQCLACDGQKLARLLDLGKHPVSNRYMRSPQERLIRYPLVLVQCRTCGLVQLDEHVPSKALIPEYDWIRYNEPEDHLDEMVNRLLNLPGLDRGARFGGISFKDDTTLDRITARGYSNTWRIDLKQDLGINDPGAGVETIQARLTPESAAAIAGMRGQVDVLIARHILEHAEDVSRFIAALRKLVAPNGRILLEVPDCRRGLDSGNCMTLWEEHVAYFTEATLRSTISLASFEIELFDIHPYPFEDSLVTCVRSTSVSRRDISQGPLSTEISRGLAYAEDIIDRRVRTAEYLARQRSNGGRIALFGAGHLACAFLNYFNLSELIDVVIDDDPHKQNLFMPGSGVPIKNSDALLTEGVTLCLLSLNPLSADRVVEKNPSFIAQGGIFASIFPGTDLALELFE